MCRTRLFIFTLLFTAIVPSVKTYAQPNEKYNSADLRQAIKKLSVLGSVLYIAAHPDDENTRLITYYTKDKLYETGYLSLTRGDGGQNLIGPELNELLGVIRTQELLQARRIDGGKQFFSRAKDFGFSKNPDETFKIWDREKVLADVVWVIRKFRPDVLITRFNTEPGKTHGHHTASSILAGEAFDAAADPNRFPEQLKYVEVWQPKRLVWNTTWWFYGSEKNFKTDGLLTVDVGAYNPLLGESYTEIAAESRSMHKSQGFGSSGTRGSSLEYLQHTNGVRAVKDIFEDIDHSWSRLPGGDKVGQLLKKADDTFNSDNPAASVDVLLEAREALLALPESHWKKVKLAELEDVIKTCLGIWTEVTAVDYSAVPGQELLVNVEIVNRSGAAVELKKMAYLPTEKDTTLNIVLKDNESHTHKSELVLPKNLAYSEPYWLAQKGTTGMFTVTDQQLIGLPENRPAMKAVFSVTIKGKAFDLSTPIVYKKTDPVKGEQYRPFVVAPALYVNLPEKLMVFAEDKPKVLEATLKAGTDSMQGSLQVSLPQGWKAEPSSLPFKFKNKGDEQSFSFKIYPSAQAMVGELKLIAVAGKDTFDQGLTTINYDHIPAQVLFPKSTCKIVKLDIIKKGHNIGYLMGAGDDVPAALTNVGYKVTTIKEEGVRAESLKEFDAIVVGIRAYNTREKLKYINPLLLDYVKNGGTLVVQYTTLPNNRLGDGKLVTDSIGPYPFKLSNERVTAEDAPIKFLNPKHPLLNTPNKITEKDFEGWIQERGLYFPNEWSKQYETVISCNDVGETAKDGGILYAKYGKGTYIYTSYSWFRELPSGVPGAYRLFVNMISAGK